MPRLAIPKISKAALVKDARIIERPSGFHVEYLLGAVWVKGSVYKTKSGAKRAMKKRLELRDKAAKEAAWGTNLLRVYK